MVANASKTRTVTMREVGPRDGLHTEDGKAARVQAAPERGLRSLSTISTVVMMYALVCAPNDPVALSAILFLTGLFLSFGFSAFGIYPSAMTTKKASPVAAALINTGGQIGAAVLPLAVGIILDRADWNTVLLFLSCCSLAGFVLLLTAAEPLAPSLAEN